MLNYTSYNFRLYNKSNIILPATAIGESYVVYSVIAALKLW